MTRVRTGLSLATAMAVIGSPSLLVLPKTGWAQIEEVVVTTRKREETLQEVPIAIDAIGSEQIERKNISSVADLTKELTSIQFDEGASQSDTRISVRGLSPTRGRQNVAVLVDGIDVSTESISSSGGGILMNNRLVDIQRVEVVKGPQLALYGRSAFAGAIQYVTKDPSDIFEATIAGDLNFEDQYNAQMSLSGPVFGDRLALRFNAAWWDEKGFYDNALTGKSLGDDEGFGLALSALSHVTDNWTVRFRAEFQDQQIGPTPTAFLKFNDETLLPESATTPATLTDPVTGITTTYPAIFRCFEGLSAITGNAALDRRNRRIYEAGFTPGGPAPGVLYSSPHCETAVSAFTGAPTSFNKSDVALATNPYTNEDYEGIDRQLIRLALIQEWELEYGTLTSRTGWIQEDAYEASDNGKFGYRFDDPNAPPESNLVSFALDGGVNAFILDADKMTRQFSQELLFRSNFGGPVQVSLGGLYWEEDVGQDSNNLTLQASGSFCSWASNIGIPLDLSDTGEDTACYGYTERPVAPLLRGGFDFGDGTPYGGVAKSSSPQDRNTDHQSIFGMLEVELSPSWKLSFEGRYSMETVEVVGPLFLDPVASGGPGSWNPCGFFFRPCTDEFMFAPPGGTAEYPRAGLTHGGPFWNQEAFEFWYDSWHPDTVYDMFNDISALLAAGYVPSGQYTANVRFPDGVERVIDSFSMREVIPDRCLQDPLVQQRLAEFDANGVDKFDLFNPYCVANLKRDDNWFSPKIILDWQVNDDINTYFSWSKAEKPGGFATLSIGSSGLDRELLEYEPEKLQVWEIGAKTRWLDGTLVVNGAGFFQDFSDKQTLVSVLNSAGDRLVNRLENTCCAEVWGLEVDATWAPIRDFLGGNWILRGAYSWLDAEYVGASVDNNSFTFISSVGNCTPKLIVRGVPDGATDRAPSDPADTVICDVSLDGKKLEDAPRGRFSGSISWNRPITGSLNLIAEADFQWTDKRYIEATNENWVESDTNTDVRLGIQGDDGRWEAFAYVNNVFDDDTIYSVLGGPSLSCCFILGSGIDVAPGGGQPTADKTVIVELPQIRAAFAPDPRVVGVRFRYRFGGL